MAENETKTDKQAKADASVATEAQNAKLEHSDETGGTTTRADALDAGVPMLQGDPSEPVGPEDAFGKGDKRGDYRGRNDGQEHFISEPIEGGGKPILGEDGQIVDFEPTSRLVPQTPRMEEIGDVSGEKGGVTTG